MLYVFTIGFDEKFIVRSLVRNPVRKNDRVLVVLTQGYEKNDRVINALKSVKGILHNIIPEENFKIVVITPQDETGKSIGKIRQEIEKALTNERRILACLSGGMRPVIVMILLALLTIKNAEIKIESEFENFDGHIEASLNALIAPVKDRWIKILRAIYYGKSVRKAAKELGIAPATVSRELKEMEAYSLVMEEEKRYRITEGGILYLQLHSDLNES